MASRGLDEVAGTNVSGAHPENEDARNRDLDTDRQDGDQGAPSDPLKGWREA